MDSNSLTSLPLTPSLLAGAFVGLGLVRLSAPQQAYQLFGLPLPLSPFSKVASEPSPFLYVNAGRDLSLGLAYFILAWQHERTAARILTFASVVTAGVDAYVVWEFGGSKYGGWYGKWFGHAVGGAMLVLIAYKDWGF